ncbi:MAG: SPOR domain-containing protein [Acetobacteraceae bacterium]
MQNDDRPGHDAPEVYDAAGQDPRQTSQDDFPDHGWQEDPSHADRPAAPISQGRERLGVVSVDADPPPARIRRRVKQVREESPASEPAGRVARLIARLSRASSMPEEDFSRRHNPREAAQMRDIATGRQKVTAFAQSDKMTRMLVYGAGGIGAILALIVGVRSLLDGHRGEIAIIAPPPVPVREKPLDPSGMHVLSGIPADLGAAGTGRVHLAPGPEQPKLTALAARYAASQPDLTEAADTPPVDETAPANTQTDKPQTTTVMAPVKTQPTPAPQPDRAVQAARPVPTDASANPPVRKAVLSASPPASSSYIQLGAFNQADKAQREWTRIARRMEGQLSRKLVYIVPKLIRGQMLYRVWVGGFPSLAHAMAACSVVKGRKLPCYAVRR